tara:strand:- start:349 stop:591 length:243 start_codon:yes stop_codon:yes gene_type:complete
MNPKPIYRVMIAFRYKKKGSVSYYRNGNIDTFCTTNVLEQIKNDEVIRSKIIRKVKTKHKDLDIVFDEIKIEGQYGNTIY